MKFTKQNQIFLMKKPYKTKLRSLKQEIKTTKRRPMKNTTIKQKKKNKKIVNQLNLENLRKKQKRKKERKKKNLRKPS